MKFPKSLEQREFRNEHEFQAWAVGRLRHLGYIVEVSSSNVRGRRQHRGISDLFIRNRAWQHGSWLHVECKGPKTRLSVEQEEAAYQGDILIWRDWQTICIDLGLEYQEQANLTIAKSVL